MRIAWQEALLGIQLEFLLVLVAILPKMIFATTVLAKVIVYVILLLGI